MGLHEVVHWPLPGGSLALMRWFIGLGEVVHRKTRKPGFFPRSFGPLGRGLAQRRVGDVSRWLTAAARFVA